MTLMLDSFGILLVPKALFFIKMFFSLCCSNWIISVDLSSSSLIHSSVISFLLLNPFSEFFKIAYCIFQL